MACNILHARLLLASPSVSFSLSVWLSFRLLVSICQSACLPARLFLRVSLCPCVCAQGSVRVSLCPFLSCGRSKADGRRPPQMSLRLRLLRTADTEKKRAEEAGDAPAPDMDEERKKV